MNKQIAEFARKELKEGLAKLPEKNQRMFKRMYSHRDLDKDIDQVVDDMPDTQLSWAMTQVSNSLEEEDVS